MICYEENNLRPMIKNKKIIFILSFLFLAISTLIYRSDICCMFSASRYYGWPSSFILVNKTTESFDEAKKVETENLINLIKNDWKVSFKANEFGQYGLTSIVILNLVTNYLLYVAIVSLIVESVGFIFSFLKK